MSVLIYAAMLLVTQLVPTVGTSLDAATPNSVSGYVECSRERVAVHVLRSLAGTAAEARFLEDAEFERQWLRAADCVDDGVVNGSLAPFDFETPFLEERGRLWVEWALAHRRDAALLLEARALRDVAR